jgi:hypothetical protein
MLELNKNIEVIAIEATAQSRVLLALKDEIKEKGEMANCLSVVLSAGAAYPTDCLNLIARETTFNAYNFFQEEERPSYKALLERYLNDEKTKIINELFTE